MGSKMLRRSGITVGIVADSLRWKADYVIQVGVGQKHQEVDVLGEEWEGVEFIGFEACPKIYGDINDEYPGELYNIAITDFVGRVPFFQKKNHADGSSLHKIPDQTMQEVEVGASTLDAQFPSNHPVMQGNNILLWLDCEGNELAALQGATRLLPKVDMINVEMTANPPSADFCSPDDVHKMLLQNGFVRQWIHTFSSWSGLYDATYVRRHLFGPSHCCDPICYQDISECKK